MKKKLTALLCALSVLCFMSAYAEDIGVEVIPEFEVILDGEPMEEIIIEDIIDVNEEVPETTENSEEISEKAENDTTENKVDENEYNAEDSGEQKVSEDNAAGDGEEIIDISIDDEVEGINQNTETEEPIVEEIAEPFSYEPEQKPEVYDVRVDVNAETKTVEVNIEGVNLTDRLASIKISPLGGYSEVYYLRTVRLDGDFLTVYADLPETASGLCSVDVDMAELGHWHKVAVAGESENLSCVSNRKTATISGTCGTTGIKSVQIKVFDEDSNIVYVRQRNSNADGSFELKVTLPAESPKYMVWMTVSGESGGYAKTIAPFNPTEAKYTYEFTAPSVSGAYVDAAIYAKNITDKKKYVYELDYSASANALRLADACALNAEKNLSAGLCENTDIEIISVTDGKIRFVVNSEVDANKLWSGTLNLIRFESNIDGNVNFTLRIFE